MNHTLLVYTHIPSRTTISNTTLIKFNATELFPIHFTFNDIEKKYLSL